MKKTFKLIAIFATLFTLIPFRAVNAQTKQKAIVEKLMANEGIKAINGEVTFGDDELAIAYNSFVGTTKSEVVFTREGNVISYDSGEVTNYDEAVEVISHTWMFTQILQAALELNGYTYNVEEMADYSGTYENNGFEFIQGNSQEFSDGTSTITAAPVQLRIDVSKVNLETTDSFESKGTTIADVVDKLNSDESFTTIEFDGVLSSEYEVTYDDETLTITSTQYNYESGRLSYTYLDNVVSYEIEEEDIHDYDDAAFAFVHEFFGTVIMQAALEANGYTEEQIEEFFSDENNSLDFELNGLELKETGEDREYTSEDGTETITVAPFVLRIDIENANLNKIVNGVVQYTVLEGVNQEVISGNKLSFRLSINYDKFVNGGKIIVDGKEVAKDNYLLSKGSIIITFNEEYAKKLSVGKHTIVAKVSDGEATTQFNIVNNPATGDNIVVYAVVLGISLIGITGIVLYKKKFN